jgi:hypothetical protein
MSIVAPEGRKHLSADVLFRLVQNGFETIPNHRLTDAEIALTDVLVAAFATLSLKAPSLLAFDKEHAEGNLGTMYGIEQLPCDTRLCESLDPAFLWAHGETQWGVADESD